MNAHRVFALSIFMLTDSVSLQALLAEEGRSAAATVEHIAPEKLKVYNFKTEEFAFVRLRYKGLYKPPRQRGSWATDYPDADLLFSDRLRSETNLKVANPSLLLDVTDPSLRNYPFAYISANSGFYLRSEEAASLQAYVVGGGFVLIDDSWGDVELNEINEELKKVIGDKAFVQLPIEHDIFHCVYDLSQPPQVFSLTAARHQKKSTVVLPVQVASYRAIFDDKGRIMILIAHNTDLADGWEHSKEDSWYGQEYSEKLAFPIGINIVVYALLTHPSS